MVAEEHVGWLNAYVREMFPSVQLPLIEPLQNYFLKLAGSEINFKS